MVRSYLIAAALLCYAPAAAAQTAVTLVPGETLLEVSATGTAKGVPDVAEFSTGVTSDGHTAQQALAANSVIAQRLVAAVRKAGISSTQVRTSDLRVRPRYRQDEDGDDTDEIVGYRASNQLTIEVRDVGAAPRLIDALVSAGATDLSGPNFSFANDEPLTKQARADAVRNAAREASDYAAALGLRLGRVLRVSERSARTNGGEDIVVTGRRVSAPIEPGEQDVMVTVWIDYALVTR